jgi:signal transduction histidine kinase/HAMP domain-containing protein
MAASSIPSIPTTGMRGGLGRTLLTAFLLLAIGPLSLVGYVAFSQVRADRQRGTVDRLSAAADLREAQLREWVHTRVSSVERWAADPNLVSALSARGGQIQSDAQEQLKTALENDPAFQQIFWVVSGDEDKWIAATTREVEPRPVGSIPAREAEQAAPHFWIASDGAPVFEFAATVRDARGQPLGFVVGLAPFTPMVSRIVFGVGRTGVVYLVNRDQQLLLLQGQPSASLSRESEGVTRALRQGQNGASVYRNVAGTPVIGVYRWLSDLEMALIAEQDQAEAFAASDELAAGLIGAALGVALLTAIIAAVVTRRITRPIVLLTEAAVRMSGGDLTVRVQPTRRDEIGILAGVFNTMATELYDLYARLEQKVAERTRELQEAKEKIQYHAWQLSISAEIGRITTSILDLDTLLERASELIRDAFQLEYVGVYLLDVSGQVAVLRKSVGRAALPHERQLSMDGIHPVSRTISECLARTTTRPDPTGFAGSEGQAEICCQLVLPLARGAKAIGALDLVSRDPTGFEVSDQEALQTLADQLSVAIENARAYSQERETANEMREIDRLRGQFLTRMSHQLATYLNTIIGFSRLMLKGLDGPVTEAQTKDLTAIRHSGQQLSRLLDDILELADLEVGAVVIERAPVKLADLASDLQTTLSSVLINPQLRLDVQAESAPPVIMADANRLRQVLSNLVVTAAEMCHEGTIALRVEAHGPDQAQFTLRAPIARDDIEGTHGVSLALSRQLVELHGGRLRVEQSEDSTLFEFILPIGELTADSIASNRGRRAFVAGNTADESWPIAPMG